MNNVIESFVKDILVDYSENIGDWRFTKFLDKKGNTLPQSKKYPGDDRWCAYPDYEYYNHDALTMLVELKTQNGYFDGRNHKLGMKKRHFESYLQVRYSENIDVRVCFAVWLNDDVNLFWETIENMFFMQSKDFYVDTRNRRNRFGILEKKTEEIVNWNIDEFRTDYWNLPVI